MTLKKENAKQERLNGCLERESLRRMKVITTLAFKLKMYKKYEHLELNRLRTDYDYYDCVFMEHFEMNYHNAQTTEKHRLEGIEFKKMFQRPPETDDDSDSEFIECIICNTQTSNELDYDYDDDTGFHCCQKTDCLRQFYRG